MADYFFDTSILIAYFKSEDPKSTELVKSVIEGNNTAAVSVITLAEVLSVSEANKPDIMKQRLALFAMLELAPVDEATATLGAKLKRLYSTKLPDALIAATGQRIGGRFYSKDSDYQRLLRARILMGEVIP